MLIRKMMLMNASDSRKKKKKREIYKDVGNKYGRNKYTLLCVRIKTEEEILGDGISGRSVEVWELAKIGRTMQPMNSCSDCKIKHFCSDGSMALGFSDLPALTAAQRYVNWTHIDPSNLSANQSELLRG